VPHQHAYYNQNLPLFVILNRLRSRLIQDLLFNLMYTVTSTDSGSRLPSLNLSGMTM